VKNQSTKEHGQEIALITGATMGIGMELARLCVEGGFRTVLVARNGERLQQIRADFERRRPGSVAAIIVQDLAKSGAAEAVVRELDKQGLAIDFLINNAGFGMYGPYVDLEWSRELEMINLNIVALTGLTKYLLPLMVKRRHGRVLNVASMAAFQPGPLMAVYYATKAYVLSYSEALANEVKPAGVTVTVLCPGATATGFEKAAQLEDSKLFGNKADLMGADVVALAGFHGALEGKTLVIPGMQNRILAKSVGLIPRSWATRLVRKIQERKDA
jgi:short-subunit dehydrogenase